MGRRDRQSVTSGARGLRHRARYRFDNLLARGTGAALAWLGLVTLAVVLASSLLLAAFDVSFASDEDSSWPEDVWQSLLRTMDPGTMAGDVGWGRRILALLITVFGLLVAGTLIGIIANAVEDRVDQMRMGRSVVIETGHVVVLGDSGRLPVLVQQLILANRSRRHDTIVVLAHGDPAQVQQEVRTLVEDRRRGRVVYRSGDPTKRSGLALVGLAQARAVIVLATGPGDAAAVKTVLAVSAFLDGVDPIPVVVELRAPETAARLALACDTNVHSLVPTLAVARMAAFAMRERGLHDVVEQLFDFDQSDVFVASSPALATLPFGQILRYYANARPIGIMDAAGEVVLNPPRDRPFEPDDRLVVLAEDLDALHPSRLAARTRPAPPAAPDPRGTLFGDPDLDEHLLVIGWNALGEELLAGWSTRAGSGSSVEIVVDPGIDPSRVVVRGFTSERVTVTVRDPLGPAQRASVAPPDIVVLLAGEGSDAAEIDTRTLLDHLALRKELCTGDGPGPRFVIQVRDSEHEELAVVGTDDVVVSQAIGTRFLAHLAEQPERRQVYLALYAADGPTIHHVPPGSLGLGGEVTMADVVDAADAAGLIAFGWRRGDRTGAITLNPDESDRLLVDDGDRILVIG